MTTAKPSNDLYFIRKWPCFHWTKVRPSIKWRASMGMDGTSMFMFNWVVDFMIKVLSKLTTQLFGDIICKNAVMIIIQYFNINCNSQGIIYYDRTLVIFNLG
jgi:hypothetical protein